MSFQISLSIFNRIQRENENSVFDRFLFNELNDRRTNERTIRHRQRFVVEFDDRLIFYDVKQIDFIRFEHDKNRLLTRLTKRSA